jgi:GH15 family glucan-1,4-alpha-glucosidase
MPSYLEDYALIGDCETAALVGRDGSIDWLCVPRFDSGACFAALLGSPEHGRWLLTPRDPIRQIRRRYREGTLILETAFETDDGAVTVIDFMPPRSQQPDLVRVVVGQSGHVAMRMELVLRLDYGSIIPWVRRTDRGIRAIAGPDALQLYTDVTLRGEDFTTVADFTVSAGQRVPFVLVWHPSHLPPPPPIDAEDTLRQTEHWWQTWSNRCTYEGPWREAVIRSLITLKALTYRPTGGIVAAPTTSLPEQLGGVRNWDYRYCWVRDATFTLYALISSGYIGEAHQLFERLLGLRNDVGLLSEECNPAARRLVGNFPQAFSHISLINTAYNLSAGDHPDGWGTWRTHDRYFSETFQHINEGSRHCSKSQGLFFDVPS